MKYLMALILAVSLTSCVRLGGYHEEFSGPKSKEGYTSKGTATHEFNYKGRTYTIVQKDGKPVAIPRSK